VALVCPAGGRRQGRLAGGGSGGLLAVGQDLEACAAAGGVGPLVDAGQQVVFAGIAVSTGALLQQKVRGLLSRYTRVRRPDPRTNLRPFAVLFVRTFGRVGYTVSGRPRSPGLRRLAFQASVGVAVLAAAAIASLLVVVTVPEAALATRQTLGVPVDPASTARLLVAFVVVCALAVTAHATDCVEPRQAADAPSPPATAADAARRR
jgi:hypothetical protein